MHEGSSNICLDIEILNELLGINFTSRLTLGGIPNFDVAVTAAGYELVRSAVVVQTEHVAGVAFQNFGSQPLFQFVKRTIEDEW